MFLAEDIMTHDVVAVSPTASLKTLTQKMANKKISSILVTKRKKPIGIISERDFVKKVLARGVHAKTLKAVNIMTSPILAVRPRDTISHAVKIMKTNKIRHLLVAEGDVIKGIISETDLLRGESNYIKAHQFLQNLIMALFLTILLLFVIVFRIGP